MPGPDAVLLPGPDADDRRDEPRLFITPAIGPPPLLLLPVEKDKEHIDRKRQVEGRSEHVQAQTRL